MAIRSVSSNPTIMNIVFQYSDTEDLRIAALMCKTWMRASQKNELWHHKINHLLARGGLDTEVYSAKINYKKLALLFQVKKYPFHQPQCCMLSDCYSMIYHDASLNIFQKSVYCILGTVCIPPAMIFTAPCTIRNDWGEYQKHKKTANDTLCSCQSCTVQQESFSEEIRTELRNHETSRWIQLLKKLKSILPLRPPLAVPTAIRNRIRN